MPIIELETKIKADIVRCFDLSRSIELHLLSTKRTREEAIAGVTRGLIGLNESVTWKATHFGIRQRLTSKITAMVSPYYFRDEQIKGAFKKLIHDHFFRIEGDYTIMYDDFYFEAPCSIVGKFVSKFILTNYLRNFLIERNNLIKECAENNAIDFKEIVDTKNLLSKREK